MKILVPVNQAASIAHGEEAPHSTELFDVPIVHLPEALRQMIGHAYNAQMRQIVVMGRRFDQAKEFAVAKPLSNESVVAALEGFFKKTMG